MKKVFLAILVFLFLGINFSFGNPGKDLGQEIERFILNSSGGPKEKVEISCNQIPNIEIPQNSEIKIFSLSPNKPKGIVPLKIEIWQGGSLYKRFNTSVETRVFDEVLVAGRNLKPFEEISFEDLKKERREVTNFSDKYFTEAKELSDFRTKRNIPLGRIIGRDAVEEIPLIKKGDKVKILVLSGNVLLTSLGIAREDGKSGEIIKVTDSNTKKIITGWVEDKNTVKIELDSK
jgi:flagella basal body P-ring formation protein FlgA